MSELLVRSLAAMAMIALALVAAVLGGYFFAVLVAAAATMMYFEWSRLVARLGHRLARSPGSSTRLFPRLPCCGFANAPNLGLS